MRDLPHGLGEVAGEQCLDCQPVPFFDRDGPLLADPDGVVFVSVRATYTATWPYSPISMPLLMMMS